MFINITDSETGSNKGSSAALVNYLEKENRLAENTQKPPGLWFNASSREISPQEVRVKIDNNIAKLGRNDAKFYLVNISPSRKELEYLKQRFGDRGMQEQLKAFAAKVMDEYARNFRRAGIEGNQNLLWYGKLEHFRYYSHNDPQVKQGQRKPGERKDGEQMHLQIVVSRKDSNNTVKLSPMNNSRGRNAQHSAKLGQFDRRAFKQSGESLFDAMFGFDRQLKDTMAYTTTMSGGTPEQKRQMQALDTASARITDENRPALRSLALDIARDGSQGLEQLLTTGSSITGGLLNVLLSPEPFNYQQQEAIDPRLKRKKKKGHSPGQNRP